MAINLKPTDAMAAEAERGLAWRREYGRGGTEVGIARARDIAGRRTLSPDTVRRMVSFFARHEVNKRAEGFRPGEDGYPSNGRIAWALWGGDPGQAWAKRKVTEMDRGESRAQPDELANGDYVEWNSSGGMARGRIARVVRNGIAESGGGFEVTGLPADPAAEIVVYEETDDGWAATEVVVAHKFSTLTKIEPLTSGDRGMATTDLDRLDVRDEVRAIVDENGDEWIEGYGIVFNELSEDLGGFRERITREAVEPIIQAGGEMRSYLNHDENHMLGTTQNGTLRLTVDDRGVKYSAKPPKTQAGRDALELVRGGYIKGSSFRFKAAPGGDSWAMEGRESVRTVRKMSYIREIGPVAEPAYRGTSAALRSLEQWQQSDPNQLAKAKLRLKEIEIELNAGAGG